MSESPNSVWTWDGYLAWEATQPHRHELVGGRVQAMGGGTAAHDIIANNLRGELRARLTGRVCRVQGPDLKVGVGQDVRYPDALIDCGPLVPGSLFAQEPVAVFEVLSKSTGWIDQTLKLRGYDALGSILSYVLISQDEPRALIYRRDPSGRLSIQSASLSEGMASSIEIGDPAVSISFAALYDGLAF